LYPDGTPAFVPRSLPTESGIRTWGDFYGRATATGIVDPISLKITPVDEVPPSEAELEARRIAAENARAEAIKAEERAKRLQYRGGAQRRARGIPTRAQWLLEHSKTRSEPWKAEDVSKATYYRRLARATGGVKSADQGLHVQRQPEQNINEPEKTAEGQNG